METSYVEAKSANSHGIPLKKFRKYGRIMSQNWGFDHELVKLKFAGKGCINKWDESKIEFESNGKKIDANFVRGYNCPKEFIIACKSENSVNLNYFWEMCWNKKAAAVVNLTKSSENPLNSKPVWYDNIRVEVLCENRFSDWIISELELKNRGSQQRLIKHFQFKNWPDSGIPEPYILLEFMQLFRQQIGPEIHPIVAKLDRRTVSGQLV